MTFDALTLFGLVTLSVMLVFYAYEDKSHWCVFGFMVSCALASVYAFLQGTWPFGIVEIFWTLVAFKRWRDRVHSDSSVGA